MEKTKQEMYEEWVDRVCRYVEEVGPGLGLTSCAMQSKPVLDRKPEVVFLGYNAREPYGYTGPDRKRFFEGNPYFYSDREHPGWRIWHKIRDAFECEWVNWPEPVTDGNFVFMNAVYFGSQTIAKFQSKEGSREVAGRCFDFTAEVVRRIFRPRSVVCFSINECFLPLARRFGFKDVESVMPVNIDGKVARQRVLKGSWGGIPAYGIPHPSARVNNNDWGGIAMWLKREITSKRSD